MEMVEEYGLNYMGENDDEDDDDEGNAVTPPAPAAVPDAIVEEAPVENGPHEPDDLDDLDDLDDDPNEGRSDMDEWFPQDGSNDRD
jgi:hypothetical protein